MQAEQRARAELLRELTALRKRVSKLEQAKQTLQESEEKWRSLAENAPNFIIITDADGSIQFINRTAPGCSLEETLGKTVYDFLEPAYHNLARAAIKRVFQTGEQSKYEARVTVPGSDTYWYETHVGPIKRDGKVTAATLISTDIGARKKAEQALQQSEEMARAFFDAIPDTAVLMDTKATILAMNRAGAERLGRGVDEIVGKNAQYILPADVFELRRSRAAEVIRTGKMVRYEDERAGLYFDTCICPVFGARGTVERLAIFVRDITLQTQLEKQIVELAKFPDENPNPVLRISEDCEVLYANAAGSGILRTWGIQVGQNLPEAWCKRVREALSSGKISTFEFSCDDGRIFLLTLAPLMSQRYLNLYGVDITTRKETEEELLESEGRWRSLAENAPNFIMIVDADGTISFINHTVSDHSVEEVVGKTIYDFLEPDYHDVARNAVRQVFQTGQTSKYEAHVAVPGSGTRWYETYVGPIKRNGKIAAATLISSDISERKKAEEALSESELRYRKLFESVPIGIGLATKDGTVLDCNNTMLQMTGYSKAGIRENNLNETYVDPEQRLHMLKQLQTDGLVADFEAQLRRKDGTTYWANLTIKPFPSPAGNTILTVASDITRRKEAEEVMQIKDKAIASSINGIAIGDQQGNLTYVNDSFLEMWGYDDTCQVLGKNAIKFWRDENQAQKIIEALHKTGSWIGELTAVRQDNSTFDVQISASAVRDQNGNLICMMASFVDVTDRKQAEDAVRDSEEKYRTLYESSMDGIASCDMEGNLTGANQACLNMLGYTSEELRKLTYQQITPPKWRGLEEDIVRNRVLLRGYSDEYEKELVKKDGTVVAVSMRAWLIKDKTGEPAGIWVIVRDITERKTREQALAESEQKFRAIFDNATDGILVADPETRQYITGNRMICQMLGYNLEEIKNMEVKDIHPEDSLTDDLRKFEKVLNREITLSEDVPIRRKDGSIFYADINTAFLRFGGKECLMGIFRDITDHKQAQQRLDRYREEVAQAERLASLGTLSATLAHELTQPLTVVGLSIENSLADLETTSCPASVTAQLKDSLAEISHTVSIIDRLRRFARKSSKEDVTEVDLKAVADRIVMLLNASAQRARVTLRPKDLDKLPPVFANEKDMEQLFFALVENAIHAADGDKNRQLIIGAAVKGQHIELRFADNCGGIAPEDLDRIFEPFFTTKSAGVGTGLGLCIVQRIVSHAGGKIRVESKTGKGSTFFVTLPINKAGRS